MDELAERCELLRSLHVPGRPLAVANAWDAASAKAIAAAGFAAVATTSGGVAASLGYEDHEGAPAGEMLAAAARIARAVDVPVTVDAERGYGLGPAELVAALREAGAAGCNLEDTDHSTEALVDVATQAQWLAAVRAAAEERGYPLVINARIDVFIVHREDESQDAHVDEALERARAYLDAGVDCVYPILLWQEAALRRFVEDAGGPVNAVTIPPGPDRPWLAEIGVARISWGTQLQFAAMQRLEEILSSIEPEFRPRADT